MRRECGDAWCGNEEVDAGVSEAAVRDGSVLQCVAVCCSVLQCVACGAVWCSVVQCGAVCRSICNVPRRWQPLTMACIMSIIVRRRRALVSLARVQHTATHYNTLQHITTHYSALQHTAECFEVAICSIVCDLLIAPDRSPARTP